MNLGLIKGMVMASFRHPLPLHWSLMASPMRIMTARTATPHAHLLVSLGNGPGPCKTARALSVGRLVAQD